MIKKKLAGVLLIAMCMSLGACGSNNNDNSTNAAEEAGTAVYTKILQPENFNRVITTGGLLQAKSTVYVIPKVSGMEEVTDVYVKVGDTVEKGQLLASLDKETAMLQYQSTKLQYDEVLKNLNNMKILYDAGAVSRNDYESLEMQFKSLEISLKGMQMSLDNLSITAPIGGTIVSSSAEVGGYATASSAMFTISDTSTLEAVAGINERNVNKIKVGDEVSIRIPTAGDSVYTGTIIEVGKVMDQNSKNYPVRVALDNSQGEFLAGMYAEIGIITDRVTDCLVVPVDAIAYKDDGEMMVMIAKDGVAESRDIITAVNDGDYYVVTEGLEINDEVIVKGNVDLVNGEKITVMKVVNQADIQADENMQIQTDDVENNTETNETAENEN